MKKIFVLLLWAMPALADRDEPNSFLMMGFDAANKKLYLKEELGKKGPSDLWTLDFVKPAEPTIKIAPFEAKDKAPANLMVVKSVVLDDVEFNGQIRKESLERHGNALMKRYDLRVTVAYKGGRSTSDIIAYRSPELQLIEAFVMPEAESPCSIALVAYTSNLGGVTIQRPLVMCPGTPVAPKVGKPETAPKK